MMEFTEEELKELLDEDKFDKHILATLGRRTRVFLRTALILAKGDDAAFATAITQARKEVDA